MELSIPIPGLPANYRKVVEYTLGKRHDDLSRWLTTVHPGHPSTRAICSEDRCQPYGLGMGSYLVS